MVQGLPGDGRSSKPSGTSLDEFNEDGEEGQHSTKETDVQHVFHGSSKGPTP